MRRPWLWLLAASGCTPAEGPTHAPIDLNSLHDQLLAHHAEARWSDPLGGWHSRTSAVSTLLLPDRIEAYHPNASDPDARITLSTARFGRGEALQDVPAGNVWAEGHSFESRRPGLTEWVQTAPDHLKHGYTLYQRPEGEGPVVIEIEVEGGTPVATADGAYITFDNAPQRLRWDGLVAWDKSGVEIPAETSVSGSHIRVELDDHMASWPITVDPSILVELSAFAGSNITNRYGAAIDVDGSRVLIGIPGSGTYGGARMLFPSVGPEEITLSTNPSGGEADLGEVVAIDGSWAAIGSPEGLVQIYESEGGVWSLATDIATSGAPVIDLSDEVLVIGTPEANSGAGGIHAYVGGLDAVTQDWLDLDAYTSRVFSAGHRLGASVAVDDMWMAAGAPGAGEVVVYRRYAGGGYFWQTAILDPNVATFGSALDVSGGRVAVGAPGVNRVYVYENTIVDDSVFDTFALLGAYVAPPFTTTNFGATVALVGDTLAVTDQPTTESATLYLYEFTGSSWSLRDMYSLGVVTAPPSVAMNETLLAVGLPDTSSVRVWARTAQTLTEVSSWNPTPNVADAFGAAVAIRDDLLAIGAPQDNSGAGTVSVYARNGTNWTLSESLAGAPGDAFGSTLALEPPWLAVGATAYNSSSGRVYTYKLDDRASLTPSDILLGSDCLSAGSNGAQFGSAIAMDSRGMLVGAPLADSVGTNSGAGCYYIYANTITSGYWFFISELTPSEAYVDDRMGSSVALSGDRLLLGSGRADDSLSHADIGRVEVFRMHDTYPLDLDSIETLYGDDAGDRFGTSLAISGDLLAVGTPGALSARGEIRIYQSDTIEYYNRVASIGGDINNGQIGKYVSLSGARLASTNTQGTPKLYLHEADPENMAAWDPISAAPLQLSTALLPASSLSLSDDDVVVGLASEGDVRLFELGASGPPNARDDVFTMQEDTSFTSTSILANDTDPDGDTIQVSSAPSGSFSYNSTNKTVSYTPAADFYGTVTADYTILADGEYDTATVTIIVVNQPDAPVANDDPSGGGAYITNIGSIVTGNVLTNDTDADGDTLTAEACEPLPTGLTFEPDGSFSYEPSAYGTYSFDYRAVDPSNRSSLCATLSFDVRNQAPEAPTDVYYDATEDIPLVKAPPTLLDLEGLSDPDGDPIVYTLVTSPTHGFLQLTEIGGFIYTPLPNFEGIDSFVLQYADETVGSLPAPNTTRFEIEVESIDDPPVGVDDGPFSVASGGALYLDDGDLLANDYDVDTQSISAEVALDLPPANGNFAQIGSDFVYVPDPYFEGIDHAWYRVVGGGIESEPVSIEIIVEPINDAPIIGIPSADIGLVTATVTLDLIEIAQITDPDGDTFELTQVSPPLLGELDLLPSGTFTYTPAPGVSGEDHFTYVAIDEHAKISVAGEVTMIAQGESETQTQTEGGEPCVPQTWYLDADADGQGDPSVAVDACEVPPGYTADARDCDDHQSEIFLHAPEIPGDGIDQDCDGTDNEPGFAGGCSTAGARGPWALLALIALVARRGGAQ